MPSVISQFFIIMPSVVLSLVLVILQTGAAKAFEWTPIAEFKLGWTERSEMLRDISGLSLGARGGAMIDVNNDLHIGLSVTTASDGLSTSPSQVLLSEGLTNKSIGLHEAYLEWHKNFGGEFTVIAGKFISPAHISPLLWDLVITPEGFFESLEVNSPSSLKFGIYAGQYSIYQTSQTLNLTPQRRSWLFEQGVSLESKFFEDTQVRLSLNHLHFFDLAEGLTQDAVARGNTLSGTTWATSYSPFEIFLDANARPLGIRTGISGAVSFNLRSVDNQRGFFFDSYLGNAWKERNFFFRLSYYYNEPDLTLALFSNHDFGHSNREGARGEVSYFLMNNLRIGTSVSYFETLAKTTFQANRKEMTADVEWRF